MPVHVLVLAAALSASFAPGAGTRNAPESRGAPRAFTADQPPHPSPSPPLRGGEGRGEGAEIDALRAIGTVAAGEPGIAEVREAAARIADPGGSELEGFPRRARLAALLPRVTAEYRRDEQSYRVVGLQGSGEVDYRRVAPGISFILRATWDLGSLVAARGEISAASQARERAHRRETAMARATSLFFERRKAMLGLLLEPPAAPLARAEVELAIDRMTAELDALTGGLYARGGRP